ncbi:Uncharacterised protein [Vibrio cholerae]|nr:Uncharacterised protein [Vibrio cholerae]
MWVTILKPLCLNWRSDCLRVLVTQEICWCV